MCIRDSSRTTRSYALKYAPQLVTKFVGPQGVTHRYKYLLVPVLIGVLQVAGALVVRSSEEEWARGHNVRSDFEDLGLNENLVWMVVFTSTGFEDGRFPKSPAGKLTSAVMGWIGIGGVFLLIGFASSDRIVRNMKERLRVNPKRLQHHVIVCGWNAHARQLLHELTDEKLAARRESIVIVAARDCDLVEQAGLPDAYVSHLRGEPSDLKVLRAAGLDSARVVVILADDAAAEPDATSLLTLVQADTHVNKLIRAKTRKEPLRTVVEIRDESRRELFESAQADHVLCIRQFGEKLLAQSVFNPAVAGLLETVLSNENGATMLEVPVTDDEGAMRLVGKSFDVALQECRREGVLLIAINTGGAPGVLEERRVNSTGNFVFAPTLVTNPPPGDVKHAPIARGDSLLLLVPDMETATRLFGNPASWKAAFSF